MKKMFVLCLTLCLAAALAVPALAAEEGRPAEYDSSEGGVHLGAQPLVPAVEDGEETPAAPSGPAGARERARFANASELYESWYENCDWADPPLSVYPDAVCGVWSTDGTMNRLTIAVTKDEAGEACKEEILSQVADQSTLTFTYQSYTYLELRQIQEELTSRLGNETGAQGIGVHEMKNQVVIDIDTANENAQAFIDWCALQYGDKVGFEGHDGLRFTTTSDAVMPGMGLDMAGGPETNRAAWMWLLCTAGVLAAALLLSRRCHAAVLARTDGGTRAVPLLTRRQTEQAVREGTVTPSRRMLEQVLEKLEEK